MPRPVPVVIGVRLLLPLGQPPAFAGSGLPGQLPFTGRQCGVVGVRGIHGEVRNPHVRAAGERAGALAFQLDEGAQVDHVGDLERAEQGAHGLLGEVLEVVGAQ